MERNMGKNVPIINSVGGGGQMVPVWVKERRVLGITYFLSMDTPLCLM